MSLKYNVHPQAPILLVGVDLTAASQRALGHGLAMARRGSACELHVIHVVAPGAANHAIDVEAARCALDSAVQRLGDGPCSPVPVWAHVRYGTPVDEIRRLGFESGADVIVLGSERAVPRAFEDEPYAPFSVMRAGHQLEFDVRPYRGQRCADCAVARRREAADSPWCAAHEHRALAAFRLAPAPLRQFRHGTLRLLH